MSDTLVFQSHSWRVLRGWIGRCVDSVRTWADSQGYDYRFMGDELFDALPAEYRTKLAGRMPIQADLARLLLAEIALNEGGFSRVLWLDADVLIFDADAFSIDGFRDACVFGREIWVDADKSGKLKAWRNVHNAAFLVQRTAEAAPQSTGRDPVLPFLIHATRRIIERADPDHIAPQMVGPKLLTALHNLVGFETMSAVAAFSPKVIDDIAGSGGPALALLRESMRQDQLSEPTAANLCASLNEDDDPRMDRAIDRLLSVRRLP